MILTEEMRKNLPLITEEELKEKSMPTDELIAKAILEFNEKADEIDKKYGNPNENS
jgi:hypothetical protein